MIKRQQDDDDDYEIINGNKVLKDGRAVRVQISMMDAMSDELQRAMDAAAQQHRNENFTMRAKGFIPMTDADRDARAARYQARDKRVSEAWKNPPPAIPEQRKQNSKPAPTLTSDERQAAKDKRLENRWKDA